MSCARPPSMSSASSVPCGRRRRHTRAGDAAVSMAHSGDGAMTDAIRVLIAEDNARFRDGLRALLDATPDIEVAGEAADGAKAVALAERLQPDVILMDLQMPGVDGIEATRRILETSPHIGALMLTMFEDDDS